MTTYHYESIAVYVALGDALRLASGARVFTTDPTTGAPVDATQGTRVAPYVDADANGDVSFTAESWPVRLTGGTVYEDVWPIDAAGPDDATVAGLVDAATATRAALDGRYLTSVPPLFADPNADRLVFWDDSAGAFAPLTASTGLTLTGTDLSVRAATDALMGGVELATSAETVTGTDDTRATTPAGVKAAIANGPGSIMGAPTTATTNGTPTTGTTVTRDAVLGNYAFTAVAGHRYRAIIDGLLMNTSVASDVAVVTVRNGGASTPTAASPVVASTQTWIPSAGGAGQMAALAAGTFVPGAGTVTLSAFVARAAGTGVETPAGSRELYAVDLGTA